MKIKRVVLALTACLCVGVVACSTETGPETQGASESKLERERGGDDDGNTHCDTWRGCRSDDDCLESWGENYACEENYETCRGTCVFQPES